MRVEVLYFAAARERAGCSSETLSLGEGTRLSEALDAIVAAHPALEALMPYLRVAVDEAFERDLERVLEAGATLALIPPVAGGSPLVELCHEALDTRAVEDLVEAPAHGGVVTFIGRVRDHTGGHSVTRLEYEAYEPMALKVLDAIRGEAVDKWPDCKVAVHHRLGILSIGEAAVVVCAAAPHRANAFEACQYVIDRLKEDVPIFKREVRGDGSVWVGLGP